MENTHLLSFLVLKQVDRSPTGSGVTARIALQYHKGLLQLNQTRTFRSSATGSVFTGRAVRVSVALAAGGETKEAGAGRCGSFVTVLVGGHLKAGLGELLSNNQFSECWHLWFDPLCCPRVRTMFIITFRHGLLFTHSLRDKG